MPTYWCGNADDLNYVEANLNQLIVRNAFKRRSAPPIAAGDLSREQQQRLIEQIRHRPIEYVAQTPVERSTAPAWNGRTIEPWRIELRTFAVSGKDGYQIMPGGLARVFENGQSIGESMAAGQSSKDVWILSDAPVEPITLLRPSAKLVELRRSTADVTSRVADNLFWLGRNAERAEAMVRHLRSCIVRLTSDLEPAGITEIVELVDAFSDAPAELPPPERADEQLLAELRREVISWLFDRRRPGTLAHTLEALRNSSSQVRDRLSIDGWRIVNQLNLSQLFPGEPQPSRFGDLVLLLNQLLNLLAALSGLGTESMTRGLGWRFLDMGRRIERAQQTLRLFRRTLVERIRRHGAFAGSHFGSLRQLDDLPLALSGYAAVGAGLGFDAGRRFQSARGRASIKLALGTRCPVAGTTRGRRAQHRTRNYDGRPSRGAVDRRRSTVRARFNREPQPAGIVARGVGEQLAATVGRTYASLLDAHRPGATIANCRRGTARITALG